MLIAGVLWSLLADRVMRSAEWRFVCYFFHVGARIDCSESGQSRLHLVISSTPLERPEAKAAAGLQLVYARNLSLSNLLRSIHLQVLLIVHSRFAGRGNDCGLGRGC